MMRRMPDQTEEPVPPFARPRWILPVVALIIAGAIGLAWGLSSGRSSTPKTFTLKGTLTLPSASTLVGTPEQKLCTGNPASGMDDVSKGASVTVYDASGSVVATGTLGAGRYPSDAFLTDPCVFPVSVPGVPGGSKFYQVEVTHRGKITVSAKEAKAGDFAASLS